jgi:hypothetical protein
MAFVVAVPLILALWAVSLLVILKYGKNQVNRLTLRPLWWTLFISVVQITIGLFTIFATPDLIWFEICSDKQDTNFMNTSAMKISTISSYWVSFCFIGFYAAILNENYNYFVFIMFQKSMPLQFLDPARGRYQQLER